MHEYLTIFLITALTGVGGLALGGGFAAAVHDPSERSVSLLLRFTAGVMISVVCFDLIAEQAPLYPLFHRSVTTAYYADQLDGYEPIGTTGLNFIDVTAQA